jgi:hypothetical protein
MQNMDLPNRLTSLIKKVTTGTAVEDKLLRLFVTRLRHTLSTLEELFGSECGEGCFRQLIGCILQRGDSACFDQYEKSVEGCITRLRSLTEQEERLVGEMVDQVVSMTELLLDLAGVTLTESASEESGTGGIGGIGGTGSTGTTGKL